MSNHSGVVAQRSRVSCSVIYRLWVRVLACSVATLVYLSKALYHSCFSPPGSTNGYQRELRVSRELTAMDWHPVRGKYKYSQLFNANETGYKYRPDEPYTCWLRTDFTSFILHTLKQDNSYGLFVMQMSQCT